MIDKSASFNDNKSCTITEASKSKCKSELSNSNTTAVIVGISGGTANAISRTLVSPFERVRLQMQVDSTSHSSMSNCFINIYKNERILGFYRGNALNVARIFPQTAIAFSTKHAANVRITDCKEFRN